MYNQNAYVFKISTHMTALEQAANLWTQRTAHILYLCVFLVCKKLLIFDQSWDDSRLIKISWSSAQFKPQQTIKIVRYIPTVHLFYGMVGWWCLSTTGIYM